MLYMEIHPWITAVSRNECPLPDADVGLYKWKKILTGEGFVV